MDLKEIQDRGEAYIATIKAKKDKLEAKKKQEEIIANYQGDDKVVSFKEIYEQEKEEVYEFIKTGHPELDEALGGGVRTGQMIVVSGYTNNGKTNFSFDLTRKMQEHNCFWLPFEENANELARKNILWKQEPIHFFTPAKIVREDLEWIEERIFEATLKHNTKIVFIDNLHFLTLSQGSNEFVAQAQYAKAIKKMAAKLGVVIFLIAHLKKSKEGIHKMPTYEDVSGSSDVVKLANKVICIWREATRDLVSGQITYTGATKVGVQKVREANGKLCTLTYSWDRGIYTEQPSDEFSLPKINYNRDEF